MSRIWYFLALGVLWILWQVFTDELAGIIREHISGGGVIMYGITHPYIIMPSLLILSCLYFLIQSKRKVAGDKNQEQLAEVSPPENKLALVAKAIMDAKQITPNGKDVIVYITTSGVLHEIYINQHPIYIQELKSILAKLQDNEKVIMLKSFPEWVQPPDGRNFTLEMSDELISRTLNPQKFNFVVDVLDSFDKWYNNKC